MADEFRVKNGLIVTGIAGFADGSASAPAIYFNDDTNTGLFRVGADQICVSAGGTERVRIRTTFQLKNSTNLDMNGGVLTTSVTNEDITITPNGTGNLTVNGDINVGTNNIITTTTNGNIGIVPNGSGKVQIGESTYNPSGITLGKLTVSRDETEGSDTGPTLMLVDGDSDANNGPTLKMYRNTENPTNNDGLGAIAFNGEDSGGGEVTYGRIRGVSTDITNGTEDGKLEFRLISGGSQSEVMQLETDADVSAKLTLLGVSQTGAVVAGASTANNAYLNILSVAHATHKAVTASVHITDSTNSEVQTELIVAHYDGSAVNFTTYGQIFDGAAAIGELEATLSGSNILIRFQNTQGGDATLAASIHATLHP